MTVILSWKNHNKNKKMRRLKNSTKISDVAFASMNSWRESHCPVCRHRYNHFPSICQLLHFLLIKLYPVSCKRRERQVGVFCESCISVPNDGNFKCPVCQSLHPHGLSRVCLILEHFLEEQFPELFAGRREALLKQTYCSSLAQYHASRISLFPKNAYATWLSGNGPKGHIGVGCDFCGMCPIIGERYKCKDCMEKIGFDLCEACYHNPVNVSGRFKQQYKPEHKFEIVEPLNIGDLLFKIYAELSANDGSDASENRDGISRAPISSGDTPQDPEDNMMMWKTL